MTKSKKINSINKIYLETFLWLKFFAQIMQNLLNKNDKSI